MAEEKLRDYLKRVTSELHRTRRRVQELEERQSEPVAIVGMACRFPGDAGSPERFWDLVASGTDVMGGFPADRGWQETGTGAFLGGATEFDAGFFGISPREALAMDPQQRHALECSWEALEHAGIDVPGLRGESGVGVFLGTNGQDYPDLLRACAEADKVFGQVAIGSAASVLSGRVAYTFGTEGPAVTVDTACSSSLVALHLAAQSLRRGECSLALAGGVTIMSTPGSFAEFDHQGGLAPDGRCKAFADAADGTGWGEGVGVLVVERLSDALANGHRVLAVVRGSAVNSDGASSGLTAPNGPSQQRVIRAALADAGLDVSDVDAVEAHGTGTKLGDPIEAQALLATYGQDRDRPLWLGSVKSNIGHTQAAAGVAGVIKMIEAMRHGVLPASLHVDAPSSHVDWSSGGVEVLTSSREWPQVDRPRRAGVSAFGISGTNAHVILEQAPAEEVPEPVGSGIAEPVVPWVVSGRDSAGVVAQAAGLAAGVSGSAVDVGWSLANERAALDERAVVIGSDRTDLVAALESLDGAVRGRVSGEGRVGVVFSGQGAQKAGMGRELAERFPVFAQALDEIDAIMPVREAMFSGESLDETGTTQPVLFAFEVALYRLMESFGIAPAVVMGHSVGEIAAAHVAGVVSLSDACALVTARASLMQALPAGGAMVSLQATVDEVTPLLDNDVSIAAVNAADAVVVSGDSAAVDRIAATVADWGRKTTKLTVSHAFHSPLMDPMLDDFARAISGIRFSEPTIPLISNLTGALVTPGLVTDPGYWVRHVREAVRFADGVGALDADVLIEIGPKPALAGMIARTTTTPVTATGRKGVDEPTAVLMAVANLWVHGAEVDWNGAFADLNPRHTDLPTRAFTPSRYWPTLRVGAGDVSAAGLGAAGHPLLGAVVGLAGGGWVLSGRISLATHPWLGEHVVQGSVLFPATGFVELALRAGELTGCDALDELTIAAPLVLTEDVPVVLQVTVRDGELNIHSRPAEHEDDWTLHASGLLTTDKSEVDTSWARTWPPAGEPLDVADFYPALAETGFGYGPLFQGLTAAWRAQNGDAFLDLVLPDPDAAAEFAVHPALLDAALQGLVLVSDGEARIPFAWQRVTLGAVGADRLRVRLSATGADSMALTAVDGEGQLVLSAEDIVVRAVSEAQLAVRKAAGPLLEVDWTHRDLPAVSGEAPHLHTVHAGGGGDPAAEVVRVLGLVQEWLSATENEGETFLVRTRHAVVVDDGTSLGSPEVDLSGAAVWGLLRSVISENPGRVSIVDTDGESEDLVPAVVASGVTEAVLRGGRCFVPRLAHVTGEVAIPDGAWQAVHTGTGSLDGLTPVAAEPRALQPGEVRIAVRAAGVNFRDVLTVLGMYPGEPLPLGLEGAGVVTETAAEEFAVGDRVFGIFPGALADSAVAPARMLAKMLPGWTFAEAASIPMVYLTAHYGLRDLGRIREGDRVLVHAAAGGVGMAAVQLARHWGATVVGTAGPGKWDALRSLGLADDEIASSRTLEFEDRFREKLGGVDLVLDSLAGEFVDATLRLLSEGGRFIEMGKTDLRDPAVLAERGITYRAFDLVEAGYDRTGEMLAEVMDLLRTGAVSPLPTTVFEAGRMRDAFRFMAAARHVGKVVVRIPRPLGAGPVLITGGTGGLGSLLARHLVAGRGVRDLVLLSRSGRAPDLVEELTGAGARVRVLACDVSDRDALAAVLAGIGDLSAVFHTAGVLADATVPALTPSLVTEVLAPKVGGARHLHDLTRDRDLSHFVLFSSVSGLLGSAGQGNYAAANTALDALAQSRQQLGLPATSLAWGPWAIDGGMMGGLSETDLARVARAGMRALSGVDGMALLDAALDSSKAVLAPVLVGGPAMVAEQVPPMLAGLLRPSRRTAAQGGTTGDGLAEAVRRLAPEDRRAALAEVVRTEVAAVLGHASDGAIEPRRAFRDLGFDSLTAVELRNRLGAAVGSRLPSTVVFDYPTVEELAEHLLAELDLEGPAAAEATATEVVTGTDPIAIVGISCRYPGGVTSPSALWDLVASGADGICPFPSDRGWETGSGVGGFVQSATGFDAGFFGISPREAVAMDPQQRLALECSWEALEHAGIDPLDLRKSDTGVYLGTSYSGYQPAAAEIDEATQGYLLTGTTPSVVSGRVGYFFGLEGPAVSVDTACSSSLVALHLASQALRRGECSLALAGGVTVMATPWMFAEFSKQGGLAADGRCKAFAEAADGTGWAEGVGVLVVERLSDARRNGHRVLAVVRGSAVNSDGASNGLTAPNGPSQQRVIRAALADAGLSTVDVDAVEAHGTGTTLGDPIEAQALLSTYGKDRDRPLLLGSVKSNIGHAQAAAGVAGVVKMVEALRRGVLPATLHVDSPSSHVDWATGGVELLTEARDWPETGRARRAGVSAFGISGTNAHVILEQAPEEPSAAREIPDSVVPWVVSGRDEAGVAAQAASLAAGLSGAFTGSAVDVGWSLVTERAELDERAVVIGADRADLLAGLESLTGAVRGRVSGEGRVGVVFSGQGAQRAGMGRELAERFPVFARALDEIDAVMPVREAMFSGDPVDETGTTQPVLFAFEVALYRLMESFGITPAVVMGHSVGEIVAAHVAGVLSLGDACALVSARASLMQALPSGGAMVSLQATVDEVEPLLDNTVSIAAVNAADAVVISGDAEAVERIAAGWDRKTTKLAVSHAFHSPLMDPMLDDFARAIAGIEFAEPVIPLVSNLTGALVTPGLVTDPGYWVRHVREPVRFADGVAALDADVLLEIGPKAALAGMIARTTTIPVTATGRKDTDEPTAMFTALANLWVHGSTVDWKPAFADLEPRRTDLPTRAFNHAHYWLTPKKTEQVAADPAGERFWDAVGRLDVDQLAGELGITDRAALEALVPALSSWRRRQDDLLTANDLCYQDSWSPVEIGGAAPSGRRLLVVTAIGDRHPLAGAVTSELTARGVEVETMELDEHACDRAALAGRLAAIGDRFDWVVSLLASSSEGEEPDLRLTTATMLLFQALGDAGSTAKFWCATRNAVTLAAGGPAGEPGQSPLWGLGRSAALEDPRRWGGLVDLPAAPAAYELAKLGDILSAAGHHSELAIRAHSVFARRLDRYRTPSATWSPKGTVLVSGGTGALGAEVTGWLAANGAEHVLLLGRGGTERDWVARLRAEHGTKITVAACDVTDYDRLAEVLDEIPEAHPLTTVIHAAGVLDDGMFEAMTPEQLAVPLAAKALGALNLHRLTEKHALDRFVLFSSVASTWGNAGQANYAAANAYLDALARYRRARGLTATTIAWGPWGEGGMADREAVSQRMARAGLTGLRPAPALDVLGRILGADTTAVTVVDVDWDRFLPHLTKIRPNALLSAFAADGEETEPVEEGPWASLEDLKPAERARAVLTAVRAAVAAVLGHRSADAIRPDQRFADLGFDSLTAVELRNQLIAATGLDLPATLVFDLPTPEHLAEHLDRALAGEVPAEDEFADLDADELIRLALGEDR